MGCTGLVELDIPANVLHIEEYAFAGCVGLKKIVMRGIEHISSQAFCGCKALETVEVSPTVKFIADDAFKDCPKLVLHVRDNEYANR